MTTNPQPAVRVDARVKALEWQENKTAKERECKSWLADTAFGTIWIERKKKFWISSDGVGQWRIYHETLEHAKAAAQADYEARILAALTPAPTEAEWWGSPGHERARMLDRIAALEAKAVYSARDVEAETHGPYEARLCKDMPAGCCDYGVVSLSEGREVCRVWREGDARAIAAALAALERPPAPTEAGGVREALEIATSALERIAALSSTPAADAGKFKIGNPVRKTKGSRWQGRMINAYLHDSKAARLAPPPARRR